MRRFLGGAQRAAIVGMLILSGLVGALGALLVRGRAEASSATFEPSHVVVPEPVKEGARVPVRLMLRNASRTAFEITQAGASCGCMELNTSQDRTLSAGLVVPPGEALPVDVVIDTSHRFGGAVYSVQVNGRYAGGADIEAAARIELTVLGAWRADAGQITFQQSAGDPALERTITLSDQFPDPGIEISKIAVSHPEVLFVSAEKVTAEDTGSSDTLRSAGFIPRHRLHLRYQPHDGESNDVGTVAVHSADPLVHPIVFMVHYKGAPPELALRPKNVVVPRNLLETAVRRTVFLTSQTPDVLPVVESAPEGVDAKLAPHSPGRWRLDLLLKLPPDSPAGDSLHVALRQGERTIVLPIQISGL